MPGSYPVTKMVQEIRRARAEVVQAANKRSPEEQLAHLNERRLVAKKEKRKIVRKLQKVIEPKKWVELALLYS